MSTAGMPIPEPALPRCRYERGHLRRLGPGKQRYERSEEVVASIAVWVDPPRQLRSINREKPVIIHPQNVIQGLLLGELGLGRIGAPKSYLASL